MLIHTYAPVPTPALHCIPPYRVRRPTKDEMQNTSELHIENLRRQNRIAPDRNKHERKAESIGKLSRRTVREKHISINKA